MTAKEKCLDELQHAIADLRLAHRAVAAMSEADYANEARSAITKYGPDIVHAAVKPGGKLLVFDVKEADWPTWPESRGPSPRVKNTMFDDAPLSTEAVEAVSEQIEKLAARQKCESLPHYDDVANKLEAMRLLGLLAGARAETLAKAADLITSDEVLSKNLSSMAEAFEQTAEEIHRAYQEGELPDANIDGQHLRDLLNDRIFAIC